jgi:hypothetical protein
MPADFAAADPTTGRVQATLEFLDGPALRDSLAAAEEVAGHADWFALAPERAARGHGLEPTGWLSRRFGLSNL